TASTPDGSATKTRSTSPSARPRSSASTHRSTSSTVLRASSIRSSRGSTPANTSTDSSSRTIAPRTGERGHQPCRRRTEEHEVEDQRRAVGRDRDLAEDVLVGGGDETDQGHDADRYPEQP